MTAISMATIHAAKHFRVDQNYGSITPGRFADIILCESIENVQPRQVYFEGRKVFEKDVMPVEKIERVYPEWIKDTVHFKRPITPEVFQVKAPGNSITVNIAELVDDQIINKAKTAVLPVKEGLIR